MREAFEKVKVIIDGWDPVDLLTCCHCPSDEYDDISIELAQMLTFDTDVETLKNDIYNIFVRDFDAGTFDKSPQECETIARKIIGNTTSEATDTESTTEFSEAVSALLETTDENTKWIIAKTREDYYPRESETMPGDDNDKLLTEKQAIAILNARIAPDNDKMIKEIDHKVVINGKPYFLAHAYTVGRDFTFTHGWYIVDRETGDLYKAYAAADLYYYIEKD
ncbi:MAG: hypothetical protein MSA52_09350 [Oscillospiraceae bacterium]|nr:hypothetical protein [Oscillospiraceae bacterium]